jgi:hypothetical protein
MAMVPAAFHVSRHQGLLDPAGFPSQLSCASSSFCPVNLEDEPFGSFVLPACPTATFCVAISPFSARTYIGTP